MTRLPAAGGVGRTCRNVSPGQAGDYIAGYTIGNDFGLHDFRDTDAGSMLRVKGSDTLGPAGPGQRDIPRAVVTSVILVTVFYLICSYAQIAGFHFTLSLMGKSASGPVFALAGPATAGGYGGTWIRRLLEPVLSRLSRRGTPLNASAVVLALFALVIALTQWDNGLFALPGGASASTRRPDDLERVRSRGLADRRGDPCLHGPGTAERAHVLRRASRVRAGAGQAVAVMG